MTDRWYIVKEGRNLGPLTAAEIRDGLRDGSFDPFDLVMREGSTVGRELVEVDEIFATGHASYMDGTGGGQQGSGAPMAMSMPDTGPSRGNGGGAAAVGGFVPSLARGEHTQPRADAQGIGQGHLALADSRAHNSPETTAGARARKRDPKKYQLIDGKSRVLGPLSAREIQSLYFKGVLDRSVYVMRQGSSAKVAVAKFVSVFAESRGRQERPKQGAHPAMQRGGGFGPGVPGQRTMLEAALRGQVRMLATQRTSYLAIAVFAVSLVFASMAGWILYQSHKDSAAGRPRGEQMLREEKKSPKKRREAKANPTKRRLAPQLAAPKAEPKQVKAPPSAKRTTRQARLALRELQSRYGSSTTRGKPLPEQAANASKKAQAKPKKPKLAALKPIVKPIRPVVKPATTPVMQLPAKPLPVAAAPAAPIAPKPAASGSGTQVASLQPGQVVSGLGPMRYNPDQVVVCEGSCMIPMRGAGGAVQVKYFKNAWGDALIARDGKAVISGLVQKRGNTVTIILQNVQ